MSLRTRMLLAVGLALGAALLGMVALGASSIGFVNLRYPGYALLVVGGSLAGTVRWWMERQDFDGEAFRQLAKARAELDDGNPTLAARAASKAVAAAGTSRTRNRALTTLAWAALGQGYPERAKAVLDRIEPPHELDVYCLAAVEWARDRPELAIQALEIARTAGTLTCDGAKLLVDCYARIEGIERAVMAALQTRKVLGAANCELVLNAARLAGVQGATATLADMLGSQPGLPVIERALKA